MRKWTYPAGLSGIIFTERIGARLLLDGDGVFRGRGKQRSVRMGISTGLRILPVLVMMSVSAVWGGTIARYDFSAGTSVTAADANVTAGAFDPAGIFGANAGWSAAGMMYVRSTASSGRSINIGNAINANNYFSVWIGAHSGFELDLSTLTFDFGYTSRATGNNLKVYVLTSIDGFTGVEDIVGSRMIAVKSTTQTPDYTRVSIDLSAAKFQNVRTGIELRFYFSDDAHNNDLIHRLDNIVLNGAVTDISKASTLDFILASSAGCASSAVF
jgi:hypothetical protein